MKTRAVKEQFTDKMAKTIQDRMELMLQNPDIKAEYEAHPTQEGAFDYLWHAAVGTLLYGKSEN